MASLVRLFAVLASALVALSFLMFATEEAERGSAAQVQRVESQPTAAAPSASGERERERRNGAVREVIEDGNDLLLAPFAGVVDTDDAWVQRLVPGALALLAYGLGLMLLANYLPKPRRAQQDWRTA